MLQAQLALGQRDYQTAIQYASKYVEQQRGDADAQASALTTWGSALAIQGEEQGSEAAFAEAVAKWKQAIQLQPQALPPRYNLARFYARRHQLADAIAECEALLTLHA